MSTSSDGQDKPLCGTTTMGLYNYIAPPTMLATGYIISDKAFIAPLTTSKPYTAFGTQRFA